jgi:hypothetical protein
MKRLLEDGHPLLLQGFFDTSSRTMKERVVTENGEVILPKNTILVYGFGQWGFFVHDPFGLWLGKKELGYRRDLPAKEQVFAGKDGLYLFRSLRWLLEEGGLTTLAWSESVLPQEILNTFKKKIKGGVHPSEEHLVPFEIPPYKEASE